jgi:competence protein ComEC
MRRATWIAAFLLLVAIALVLFSSCHARRDVGRAPAPTPPTRPQPAPQPPPPNVPAAPGDLVIRVLDVGQGDATLVTNGRSTALIDGGPDGKQLGVQLDRLGLGRDTTIDLVILSHAHSDHYMGLRELFSSARRLRIRYFFENRDVSPNKTLKQLRDSVIARANRGELTYRDSDDPCNDGRPVCRIAMTGGAHLDLLRPDPAARDVNDRSSAVKIVAADSGFTMWLAGDAEHEAIAWFDSTDYDRQPGMDVDVLKADHHGSCNGVTARYLAELSPARVIASLGTENDYGHIHEQAKATYRAAGVPWYRTDRNGTVTIRVPAGAGRSYTVTPERPGESLDGPSDRASRAAECLPAR